jgi:two-component system, cell cycle response regulator DivK
MKMADGTGADQTLKEGDGTSGPLESSMTVLIVEDYDDTRELLDMIFSLAGHTVVQAADGEAAVRLAEQHRPAVIVMDLSLPICDGLTAARRIKAVPSLRHVPILAHTAKTDPLEAGHPFVAVLTKPCRPDVLLAAVEAHAVALPLARTA